jgi:hypothetical protein
MRQTPPHAADVPPLGGTCDDLSASAHSTPSHADRNTIERTNLQGGARPTDRSRFRQSRLPHTCDNLRRRSGPLATGSPWTNHDYVGRNDEEALALGDCCKGSRRLRFRRSGSFDLRWILGTCLPDAETVMRSTYGASANISDGILTHPQEVPPSHAMENGVTMPELGHETEPS